MAKIGNVQEREGDFQQQPPAKIKQLGYPRGININ